MKTIITPDPTAMGRFSAQHAAAQLREAIRERGTANLIVATGASQFEVLSQLTAQPDVDWSRVHGFHLDEYIGIAADHPASFCGYLRERFVDRVPLASFHYLRGDQDAETVVQEASTKIAALTVDVAMVGIGENGHLAFNDPPADFDTESPYLIVELDEPCRQQQVGEGWFATLGDVPTHAISMSVKQILKARHIFCSVPDERKSQAVHDTICGPITPEVPASILRQHPDVHLVIDEAAAAKLAAEAMSQAERFA